jgi:nucleoredoxin
MKLKVVFLAVFTGLLLTASAADWQQEFLGSELRDANGETVSIERLKGKIVGLYFSAHWCPPCRKFTPALVKFYDQLQQQNQPFEIVLVSSDKSEKEMYKYMQETKMKWLALPYGRPEKKSLSNKFSVSGIPDLIILDADGKIISRQGRADVTENSAGAFAKWTKSAAKDAAPADDGRPAISGAEVGVWTQDLAAAQILAKEKQLPLLLNFTGSDWCGWCKLMDRNVFSQDEWKQWAKKNIVLAYIDTPRDKSLVPEKFVGRNQQLAQQYSVSGFPTYILLKADGQSEIARLGASREATAQSFILDLKKALLSTRPGGVKSLLSPEQITALEQAEAALEAAQKPFDEALAQARQEYQNLNQAKQQAKDEAAGKAAQEALDKWNAETTAKLEKLYEAVQTANASIAAIYEIAVKKAEEE